jgi:hypothetical protein
MTRESTGVNASDPSLDTSNPALLSHLAFMITTVSFDVLYEQHSAFTHTGNTGTILALALSPGDSRT